MLTRKVTIVAGAGSGLGEAVALLFAALRPGMPIRDTR